MDLDKLFETPKIALDELKRDEMESGKRVDAKDFPEAIQKIYELYKQGRLNVYCPDVFEFKYTGDSYQLCAVSGKRNREGNIKYGLAHSLEKHTGQIVNGEKVTEEQLVNAMKRTQDVLEQKLQNEEEIFYNKELNRIMFEDNGFLYAVVLPNNNKEVCFLVTVFKADNNYLRRLKKRYRKV